MGADLATVGESMYDIPVRLSYRIIDLFSGQLYSSPLKAVEELVANSYDAFATQCVVAVPEGAGQDKAVWVWDDGDSMDLKGLEELWLIAETRKRDADREKVAENRGRLPIGKFGIGKLASYVLGRRITHICKKNGTYLAVTMDFSKITQTQEYREALKVRRLSESDLTAAVPFVEGSKYGSDTIHLFDSEARSWTLVVVDRLKQPLQIGRLQWILSTALPLAPDFQLFLNGQEVKSSKEKIKKLQAWQIGKDDKVAEELDLKTSANPSKDKPFDYCVEIPPYGAISGEFELYQDPLNTGKAAETGHSNGFFIMARKRLINMSDNRYGITSIPLGLAFTRFRAVIHADFLDRFLTASREDTTSAGAKAMLQKYLQNKFNEVRNYHERYMEKEGREKTIEDHLTTVPRTLLIYPLRQAMERLAAENRSGYSIHVKPGQPIISSIQKIEQRQFDSSEPLAKLEEGTIFANISHPFYYQFAEFPGIRKLVIAEVMLEAYLLDAGVGAEQTAEILTRRDELLRVLASKFPESAIQAAELIRRSVNSEDDLEVSCIDGLRILGFHAVRLGGSGKPDGLATALLGIPTQGAQRKYSVTIDAKSSQDGVVQSGNLGLATVARHRNEWKADYAVVITPGYQVSEGDDSKAVKEAQEQKVCLLKASDFADLVAASAVKPLSLDRLRELFTKYSPGETAAWIDAFRKENPPEPPIRTILETVWKMQAEDQKDAPTISAVRYAQPSLQRFSSEDIEDWLRSISRLLPDLVVVIRGRVQLNQTPENIIKQCVSVLTKLPKEISTESMMKALAKN